LGHSVPVISFDTLLAVRYRTRVQIPKSYSETEIRRRTDNTMAQRERTTRQTI